MGTGRGGMRCIKILLFIFNLTFWLAGLAVIAFGLWMRFGGIMADFASDKKSPEYFFMGSCTSPSCLHTGRIAVNAEL